MTSKKDPDELALLWLIEMIVHEIFANVQMSLFQYFLHSLFQLELLGLIQIVLDALLKLTKNCIPCTRKTQHLHRIYSFYWKR